MTNPTPPLRHPVATPLVLAVLAVGLCAHAAARALDQMGDSLALGLLWSLGAGAVGSVGAVSLGRALARSSGLGQGLWEALAATSIGARLATPTPRAGLLRLLGGWAGIMLAYRATVPLADLGPTPSTLALSLGAWAVVWLAIGILGPMCRVVRTAASDKTPPPSLPA